ncbi:MAG: RidA family protein [Rhodothermales bacterium]|nr:RidA family protein [Rhodothermales bacterium]
MPLTHPPACMDRNRPAPTVPRTTVKTPLAPAAIGPYSQGILAGDTLYCSGQIAIDPRTGSMITRSVEAETERVLENLGAVLHCVGMDYENVVRCTVYLTDINDYAQVNEVYSRYFNEEPPARVAVQVAALPRGARVEISCVAVR